MKLLKGIVKDKKILLNEKPDVPENSKAIVLLYPAHNEKNLLKRQLEILNKGFPMGGIQYKNRKELHER